MVSVSLRQKPSSATDQNAPALACAAASAESSAAASVSVRPVSGTPLWARNDLAPGTPRPASPWDEWFVPPKPAALVDTCEFAVPEPDLSPPAATNAAAATAALAASAAPTAAAARGVAAVRKPSPHPIETCTASTSPSALPGFRPWRVDFAHPDVVEYPEVEQPETSTVTKRLVLLLGLAYLFLAALTSGLAYTGYFTTTGNSSGADHGPSGDPNPGRDDRPDDPLPRPRPPVRDPDAPGLHTRPDGTRYLVMPLPADLADRFRDRANAVHASHAAHAVHPFRAVNPTHAAHAVHPAHAFGGGAL